MTTLESEARRIANTIKGKVTSPPVSLGAAEAAGKLRKVSGLKTADAEGLFRTALAGVCGSTDLKRKIIIWRDGHNELLLFVGQARLATSTRLIVISIPVYTDQTGETEVVVPFVTSAAADSVCLIAATETRPRGPASVIDVFGESLVAVAWASLVDMAAEWAVAVGQKIYGIALVPAGLSATKTALYVSAQMPCEEKRR